MKKAPIFLILAVMLFSGAALRVSAAGSDYELLQPLPLSGPGTSDTSTNFSTYITSGFKLGIGIAGAAAVFMVIFGGFEYIFYASAGKKDAGKKRIENAIYGLLIALGSYLVLYTINPNLVKFNANILPPISGGSK